VAAFVHDGVLAVAGMNLGSERDPGWSHNLAADPHALITVGARDSRARATGSWRRG
jgi:F420H(2)-dependent quinone reductase